MLLGSPENTPYDLRFRLLGIPVRVHPLFWLVMVLLCGQTNNLLAVAVFVGCAFVSVLVHEMGHGLSSRAVGSEPMGIVLYAMGGFCQLDPRRQTPGQRLFVLLMGPGAGFILMGMVILAVKISYGIHPADAFALVTPRGDDPLSFVIRRVVAVLGLGGGDEDAALALLPRVPVVRYGFLFLLEINFLWGILNLLPIWPLDGGQATGVVLGVANPRQGSRWAHVVSLLTAGGIAVWWVMRKELMLAVWFGYFALINYQILQTLHTAYRFADEDPEWWRR
jgi:membrane-associated protease RseP (regulator of RpoE activity)